VDSKGLIKYYNRLVSLMVEGKFRPSYGRRGGFKFFTEKNLKDAEDLLEWLTKKGFDPARYLAGCFADHNWCYQPKWGLLQRPRYQKAYQENRAGPWLEILEREHLFADDVCGDPDTTLHPGHEIIKARHFSTEETDALRKGYLKGLGWSCYFTKLAGRFNPESKFCRRCSYRDRCR